MTNGLNPVVPAPVDVPNVTNSLVLAGMPMLICSSYCGLAVVLLAVQAAMVISARIVELAAVLVVPGVNVPVFEHQNTRATVAAIVLIGLKIIDRT